MIRLTLYKNCILNDSYKNLFYTGKALPVDDDTVLDTYLNSLTKLIIDNEQISNTYQENTGTMVFSFENATNENIYEFNYMKIEWRILNEQGEPVGTWLKRYCFIDDIRIKNDVAYFDYTEDVFSSFVNADIKSDVFKLSRHRFLGSYHNNEPVKLPIDYEGNNGLYFGSFTRVTNQKYFLFASIQYYKTAGTGDVTEKRETNIFQLCKIDTGENIVTYELTLEEAEEICKYAVIQQGADTPFLIRKDNLSTPERRFYQISNFIILPAWTPLGSLFERPQIQDENYFNAVITNTGSTLGTKPMDYWIGCLYPKTSSLFSLQTVVTLSQSYDYKYLSIGTINTQIPIVNNKTSITGYVYALITNTSFDLYLNCMNTLIDITKDFIYEVPFTSVLGEENQSLQMNRALKNIGYVLKTAKGIFDLSSLGVSDYSSQIEALKYTPKGRITTNKNKWNKIRALQQEQFKEKEKIVAESLDGGITNGIMGFINTNKPTYSSLKGTFNVSNAMINAYYGIGYLKINPDNNDYVTKAINESGYETFKYEDSLSDIGFFSPTTHTSAGCKWDIYQFEDITLYGNFPRNVGKMLEKIFSDGFKMFYVPEPVSTDTYSIIT